MPELWYAGSLNLSCIPNLDCASALPPRHLHAAPVAVLVLWWLWRFLLPFELFAGRGDDRLPAIQEEQPLRAWTVIDADQVGVAAAAIENSIRAIPLSHGLPHASADGYFRYPSIDYLELEAVPQVPLLDAKFMEEMARGLPHAVEMLREASIQYDDPIRRLCKVAGDPTIFHADLCALATESTEMVIQLKIPSALVCFIWRELNGQNQQLCQELKEECFTLVAGQSVENLLEVARAFSDADWCACHIQEVLTILDALIDVLYNVQGLPLNTSDEIAVTLSKMVDALGGIVGRTITDIDNSEKIIIHPATVVYKHVLEFLGNNTDIMQSILATGDLSIDPHSQIFRCWVRKLEEDAETICQGQKEGEKCRKHIIVLNNVCDVWQKMRCPGASFSNIELVSSLICMVQQYMKSYLDECWVPFKRMLLREDYLKSPRRTSLGLFTQEFDTICRRQMAWTVLASFRYDLRYEIHDAVVTPYEAFVCALQANPRRLSELVYPLKRFMQPKKYQKEHTVEQLEKNINSIFEG